MKFLYIVAAIAPAAMAMSQSTIDTIQGKGDDIVKSFSKKCPDLESACESQLSKLMGSLQGAASKNDDAMATDAMKRFQAVVQADNGCKEALEECAKKVIPGLSGILGMGMGMGAASSAGSGAMGAATGAMGAAGAAATPMA